MPRFPWTKGYIFPKVDFPPNCCTWFYKISLISHRYSKFVNVKRKQTVHYIRCKIYIYANGYLRCIMHLNSERWYLVSLFFPSHFPSLSFFHFPPSFITTPWPPHRYYFGKYIYPCLFSAWPRRRRRAQLCVAMLHPPSRASCRSWGTSRSGSRGTGSSRPAPGDRRSCPFCITVLNPELLMGRYTTAIVITFNNYWRPFNPFPPFVPFCMVSLPYFSFLFSRTVGFYPAQCAPDLVDFSTKIIFSKYHLRRKNWEISFSLFLVSVFSAKGWIQSPACIESFWSYPSWSGNLLS